jgi:hypothetical protein
MNPNDVRLRQQLLLIRSTELRHGMQQHLQSLERPAAWADHLRTGVIWLYQHPQWPALGLVLLLLLKPTRLVVWSGRLWWLWKSARTLRRVRDAALLHVSRVLPP